MYVCMYVCMHNVYVYVHVYYAGLHLEKWTRGGKIILRETLGGRRDCDVTASPSRSLGACPLEKF